MRITQNMMYSSSVSGMNSILNKLYYSAEQNNTQLKINRPSDDPLGAGRVAQSRTILSNISLYQDNISAAKGWLSYGDSVLTGTTGSVTTLLTRAKELAQQGASGTYDGDNREQISYELRQIYEELMALANTDYNGQYIFSGHKTDTQAYGEALGVTVKDTGTSLDGMYFETEGGASYTVIIQALTTGPAETASYRYSPDGGGTWIDIAPSDITANYPEPGRVRITAGGASVIMDMGATVNAVDTSNNNSKDNGTWLLIRPTAAYQGDDNDTQVAIPYGSTTNTSASASGYFSKDVTVRIDDNDGTTVTYSYSSDSGLTWTQASTQASSPAKLPVPGGYLDLANAPAAGEQYVIHPHRAEITLAISGTSDIALNLIGKEVFGGVYTDPATGQTGVVNNGGNIFEIMGNLIAAAETNCQDDMGQAVAALTDALNVVTTSAAILGGRSNRLEVTSAALTLRNYSETDRLSSIEDVNITELLSRISSEQTAYSAILQTSSIIMQQSLLNYL